LINARVNTKYRFDQDLAYVGINVAQGKVRCLTSFSFNSDLNDLQEVNESFFKQDTGIEKRDCRPAELNGLVPVHWMLQ
jgi:hypothetical protein